MTFQCCLCHSDKLLGKHSFPFFPLKRKLQYWKHISWGVPKLTLYLWIKKKEKLSKLTINFLIKKKKKDFWKHCWTNKLTCLFLLCKCSTFTPKMQGRRMGTSGRITKSTSVSGEMYKLEHNDGSQSDTAVGMVGTGGKKRRSSLSAKVVAIVSRRSRSTSQLSQTGE